jgi:hypothetical protein
MSQEPLTPEQTTELLQWRDRKLSPKEIARQMGLRPAIVSEFLRGHSELLEQARQEKGELPPLVTCVINQTGLSNLLEPEKNSAEDASVSGIAQIILARKERNSYLVSTFMVDYFCLGVKDAMFNKCDRTRYEFILHQFAMAFAENLQDLQTISLEQAQAIVFGAVDYAATLGFKPHADFEEAKLMLGPRLETLQHIEFGRSGKPFYMSGPYDKPQKIIQTLRDSVGEGNFDYMVGMPNFSN